MTTEALEQRVVELENRMREMESRINTTAPGDETLPTKPGWRAFVGVDASNPDFAEAVQLGRA